MCACVPLRSFFAATSSFFSLSDDGSTNGLRASHNRIRSPSAAPGMAIFSCTLSPLGPGASGSP